MNYPKLSIALTLLTGLIFSSALFAAGGEHPDTP